jgi:hypothetical protein
MTAFYDDLASEAHELLAEFGESAVLIRETDGAYVPGTGRASVTRTTTDTKAVTLDYNANEVGGNVLATDTKILVSAKGITSTPVKGDRIRVGGTTYGIENVRVTKPGGTAVVIELQARA